MKTFFAALLIISCAKNSDAAMRYDKPAPLLHSILDSPQRTNNNIQKDGWAGRMNESVPSRDEVRQYRSMKTPPSVWRSRGVGFIIAGGTGLLVGAILLYFDSLDVQQQRAAGGHVYTNWGLVFPGIILVAAGIIFTLIGVPIWLTHLHG